MDFYCPTCQKVIHPHVDCDKLQVFFISMRGGRIWRIRFLNRYAYQYLSEQQYHDLIKNQDLILSNANCWDDFNPEDFTGLNSCGERTSIFE